MKGREVIFPGRNDVVDFVNGVADKANVRKGRRVNRALRRDHFEFSELLLERRASLFLVIRSAHPRPTVAVSSKVTSIC